MSRNMTITVVSALVVVWMAIATAKVLSRRSLHGLIHSKTMVSHAYYSKIELLLISLASLMTTYKSRRLRR
jgi:hypothetical protein